MRLVWCAVVLLLPLGGGCPASEEATKPTIATGIVSTTGYVVAEVVAPQLVRLERDRAFEAIESLGLPEWNDRRYIASNSIAEGAVRTQSEKPGTKIGVTTQIGVTFSAGGPAVSFAALPEVAREHAKQLAGYDETEPVLITTTSAGIAYKTDAWLFGPCAAVNEAYRTYQDPRYDDSCY